MNSYFSRQIWAGWKQQPSKGLHSVATGERVSNVENLMPNRFQKDMVVRTEKGTEVVVDMVVLCTGIKINSSAYAATFGK